jgi:hypothetical protein
MKHILLIIALFAGQLTSWAAEQTVTLVVSGQGKTKNEAQQNALRSAIEQAFGAFISSKTEILNDELVRDEVVSVSNGNIHGFEIVSSTEIPNGGGFAMTLKATVSVTKLTAFAEQKGALVEFKGALFSENIRIKAMYERNEAITVSNICHTARQLFAKSFDYSLIVAEPTKSTTGEDKYDLLMTVDVNLNANYANTVGYFVNSLSALSCNKEVVAEYETLKKPIYRVYITDVKGSMKSVFLRDGRSAELIKEMGNSIELLTHWFVVKSSSFEIDTRDNTINSPIGYGNSFGRSKNWTSGKWALFEEGGCVKSDPNNMRPDWRHRSKRAIVFPTKGQTEWKCTGGQPTYFHKYDFGVYFSFKCGRYRLSYEGLHDGYFSLPSCYFPIRYTGCDTSLFLSFYNPLDQHITKHKTIFRAKLADLEKITEITVSPKAINN